MEHHWKNLPDNWYEYEGFVYLITNKQTNQKYIGRKYFYVQKGTRIVKESDWKTYYSSSKKLKTLIETEGKENFDFTILSVHRTRGETNYAEIEEQIKRNVLKTVLPSGEEEYYNDNIMSRYFRPKDFGTPEYEARCKACSKGLKAALESGRIVHGMLGKTHTKETKKKLSAKSKGHTRLRGIKKTEEAKKKMSLAQIGNTNGVGKIRSPESKERYRLAAIKREQEKKERKKKDV